MAFPKPDKFSLALIGTAVLASALPAEGMGKDALGVVTKIGVALVFFLHGANLSREAVIAGISRWKLHATIFSATFVLFPLLGLAVGLLPSAVLAPALAAGVLYLCCLPSTVQSAVTLTSMAHGNVPAAVCSASASNLIGVVLTPLAVGLLLQAQGGGISLVTVENIALQLLLPFLAGQVLRTRLGPFVARHKKVLQMCDRGSILLVVYGAFGEAMLQGLWRQVGLLDLAALFVVEGAVLAAAMLGIRFAARGLGFDQPDQITALFCGSTKSLATGVPLANILFAGPAIGMIVLPVMLFHQMQLITCSVLAQRAARAKAAEARLAVA